MGVPGSSAPLLFAPSEQQGGYTIERSLRFNASDSAFLSRTPSSAGNRKTWTWAGWVKRSTLGQKVLFSAAPSNQTVLWFEANGSLEWTYYTTGYVARLQSAAVYRDMSAWYHIVCAVDTTNPTADDRVKLYVNGVQLTSFALRTNPSLNAEYDINNNVAHRICSNSLVPSAFFDGLLADIHFIDSQALTPSAFGEFDTNNVWQPKAYSGSYGTNGFHLDFADNSAATATALGKDTSGNGNNWKPNNLSVTGIPRPSYTATNTTTAANAFDGNLGTFWTASGNPATSTLTFSQSISGTTFRFYMSVDVATTEFRINGSAPTGFTGAKTLAWYDFSSHINGSLSSISVGYSVPYGINYIQRIAAIEVDGVIVTPFSIGAIDSLVDSPTNYGTDTGTGGEVRGNYATLNPLSAQANAVLANGNLDWSRTSTASMIAQSTIAMSTGKWYCEFTATTSSQNMFGLQRVNGTVNTSFLGGNADSWGYFAANGNKYNNNTNSAYGSSYGAGDVIGIAFDADNGTLNFYKNGVSQGQAYSGLTNGPYTFAIGNGADGTTASVNFGQRPFAYTAPSGFKALCTANLPTPTIANGATAMDVKLYTGNGSTQTISGLNFSPDLVIIKSRSFAEDSRVVDTVRGATNAIFTSLTTAELTQSTGLTAFNSDGFTLGSFSSYNQNSSTFVAWCWDAGSSTVTNTQGSITSQVRANASAGFSIVTYTGNGINNATVGHGLGVRPALIIIKRRGAGYNYPNAAFGGQLNSGDWFVAHASSGTSNNLALNRTQGPLALRGGVETYDSTTFTCTEATYTSYGTTSRYQVVNDTGIEFVAYCFAPVASFSAYANYIGNGSADGPFIYLGWRPAAVLIKYANGTTNWIMIDDKRDGYNVDNNPLYPNLASAEGTTDLVDIACNGFKIRSTDSSVNANGGTYIYAAWAALPFAYARAR